MLQGEGLCDRALHLLVTLNADCTGRAVLCTEINIFYSFVYNSIVAFTHDSVKVEFKKNILKKDK